MQLAAKTGMVEAMRRDEGAVPISPPSRLPLASGPWIALSCRLWSVAHFKITKQHGGTLATPSGKVSGGPAMWSSIKVPTEPN